MQSSVLPASWPSRMLPATLPWRGRSAAACVLCFYLMICPAPPGRICTRLRQCSKAPSVCEPCHFFSSFVFILNFICCLFIIGTQILASVHYQFKAFFSVEVVKFTHIHIHTCCRIEQVDRCWRKLLIFSASSSPSHCFQRHLLLSVRR